MTEYHHSDRAGDAGATFRRWAENDREETSRARQAAEALFAPRRRIEPLTPANVSSVDQTARKPRVLSAVRGSRAEAIEAPVNCAQPKRCEKIPPSHFARIRTWLKYGMTVHQVADIYGATISDVESALQKA